MRAMGIKRRTNRSKQELVTAKKKEQEKVCCNTCYYYQLGTTSLSKALGAWTCVKGHKGVQLGSSFVSKCRSHLFREEGEIANKNW